MGSRLRQFTTALSNVNTKLFGGLKTRVAGINNPNVSKKELHRLAYLLRAITAARIRQRTQQREEREKIQAMSNLAHLQSINVRNLNNNRKQIHLKKITKLKKRLNRTYRLTNENRRKLEEIKKRNIAKRIQRKFREKHPKYSVPTLQSLALKKLTPRQQNKLALMNLVLPKNYQTSFQRATEGK